MVLHPILPTSSSLLLTIFHHTLRTQIFHPSQPTHSCSAVTSLYTNIPHNHDISGVFHFKEKYKHGYPYAHLFMGKKERTIILAFFHLIYFWKRFTGDILFIFLGFYTHVESLMALMNTVILMIKYTFTYSKQFLS